MVHPSLVDPPVQPPSTLPARTPKQQLQRWTTAPVYETLTTNVNVVCDFETAKICILLIMTGYHVLYLCSLLPS
jgi:hypothetical protein